MAPHPSRPCWQCSHCDSVVCPDPATGGLRPTGELGHDCPLCHRPLSRAVLDHRDVIETCDRCKGILMPLTVFAETLTARRRAAATPSVIPVPTDPLDLGRRVVCPNCKSTMLTDWYYGPGNIIIDTCERCGVVWLDAGEFDRAVDAPGAGRRS